MPHPFPWALATASRRSMARRSPPASGVVGLTARLQTGPSSPRVRLRAICWSHSRSFARSSSPSGAEPHAARSFLSWYSRMLDERPLLTKGVSSGLIAAAGDLLCQYIVKMRERARIDAATAPEGGPAGSAAPGEEAWAWWDAPRTGRFLFLGGALVAPVIHWWYGTLAVRWPGTHAAAVLGRVAVDQFAFTPLYLPVWLAALWTLEGAATGASGPASEDGGGAVVAAMGQRLRTVLPSLVVANWGYWIPVQIVNFRFLPIKYQVLFSNVAALLWTSYLSFSANDKKFDDELDELPMV